MWASIPSILLIETIINDRRRYHSDGPARMLGAGILPHYNGEVIVNNIPFQQKRLLRSLFYGRNILVCCGASYILGGMVLVAMSWQQSTGPYAVGSRYPYGGPLESWQVSNGFAFVAFGLAFLAIVSAMVTLRSRVLWAVALGAFVVMWFPHMWIGITFLLADPTFASLQAWSMAIPLILAWMLAAAVGFGLAWKGLGKSGNFNSKLENIPPATGKR